MTGVLVNSDNITQYLKLNKEYFKNLLILKRSNGRSFFCPSLNNLGGSKWKYRDLGVNMKISKEFRRRYEKTPIF